MPKIICKVDCPKYMKGGFGERCCLAGLWDERSKTNKPRLDENYSIIKPSSCFVKPPMKMFKRPDHTIRY